MGKAFHAVIECFWQQLYVFSAWSNAFDRICMFFQHDRMFLTGSVCFPPIVFATCGCKSTAFSWVKFCTVDRLWLLMYCFRACLPLLMAASSVPSSKYRSCNVDIYEEISSCRFTLRLEGRLLLRRGLCSSWSIGMPLGYSPSVLEEVTFLYVL